MNSILAALSSVITTALPALFLMQILKPRFEKWLIILIDILLSTFTVFLHLFSVQTGIWNETLAFFNYLFLCIILPLICFRDKFWRLLSFSLIFFALLMLCDGAIGLLFSPLYGLDLSLYPSLIILVYMAIFILSYTVLATFCSILAKTIGTGQFQPYYFLFILLPVSQYMVVVQYVFSMSNLFLVGGILLGIGADLSLFAFAVNRDENHILTERLHALEHIMESEQLYYKSLEEEQKNAALFRHDFNNQLAVINRLISEGNTVNAKEMVETLSDDLRTATVKYSSNPTVNALLIEKQNQCLVRNLSLDISLALPEDSSINAVHLCSILSNLLDNAMNGAETSGITNPTIKLSSSVFGDYLIFKTENPYSENPHSRNKKENGHGYGSIILKRISEIYNGSYQTDANDGMFTALVSVLIA